MHRRFTRSNQPKLWQVLVALLCAMNSICLSNAVLGQTQSNQPTVEFNFPEEIELRVLVDYVSERLNIKILYDESLANQPLTVRAPGKIPVASLTGILQSALRMKGFSIVDADWPGWKRIVRGPAPAVVLPGRIQESSRNFNAGAAVTQAFPLQHVTPTQVSQAIRPFLSPQDANAVPLEAQRLLVVTDYADNLLRIARLIDLIDRAGPQLVYEFYQVRHAEASVLSEQVQEMLAVREKATGATRGVEVGVTHDERTNHVAIIGVRAEVDGVLQLLRSMDLPLAMTTEIYDFQHVKAERIDHLIRELMDPAIARRLYRSAIDEDENLLIVTTTAETHDRIRILQSRMDVKENTSRNPVRFYKLRFADANDVLQTLQAIESSGLLPVGPSVRGVSATGRGIRETDSSSVEFLQKNSAPPGPNSPNQLGSELQLPPAMRTNGVSGDMAPYSTTAGIGMLQSAGPGFLVPGTQGIAADPTTNSLIVVGPPSVQQVYEELIQYLDRKRPQVLIEAKVVQVDASDDFAFGLELTSGNLLNGDKTLYALTSYGLSAVDPTAGALALSPGPGLNSTLVSSDSAGYVLRALTNHRRSRVLSSPRILINDNDTGVLASVSEVPFTSINASQTVATTSFAGFAEAGTTIRATPRIADDNTIELEYSVSLNSFTGTGSNGSPPPRQTDEVKSSVTIPDGHTLIVGGLTHEVSATGQQGIPYIERIPILGRLTSSIANNGSRSTLFIFLRPVILKDDKFRDLRFISENDLRKAKLPGRFPASEPLTIREHCPPLAGGHHISPLQK